jgi:hypothetical protein
MSRILHLTGCLGVAVCCLTMASCSRVVEKRLDVSEATLEGTITYNGSPVPYALVIVAHQQAPGSQGTADAAGKYMVKRVPQGEVQIAVNTEAGRGMATGKIMAATKGKGELPKFVDVPKKYFDPKTSGITTNVKDGANTFNIQLK